MGEQVVNVCFHGIGVPARELEPGEDRYWVTEDQFHAVLDEIRTWPSVRISFDDGNASDARIGLPALVERGLTADFFVLAGRLGTAGSLDEDDVRELGKQGMGVGSHGMAHRSWRGMDEQTRRAELVEARDRIAGVSGSPVEAAACPLGRYDRELLNSMRSLGYTRVYTSDRRHARGGSWLQPRFSVRREDTPESLRAEVLHRPPLVRRAKLAAIGTVKRLR
ncbi:polysaccharide deacetylase family protein [Actinoplanes friuliensis]|uniref:Polysaccharide deacetylase n=1 Tax=Actinoplanes friuliensis DSM 7358 TaxID=1246995 RepID=U5VWV9_9ACTN|nr:polysaccharide deacetylase family protein [Actinoplanes friuliensis]AGZ41483.1 polysaccharide deacetylase [Actinoplanes friuliensis DSM 7358]